MYSCASRGSVLCPEALSALSKRETSRSPRHFLNLLEKRSPLIVTHLLEAASLQIASTP
jgi:hypothetical protein